MGWCHKRRVKRDACVLGNGEPGAGKQQEYKRKERVPSANSLPAETASFRAFAVEALSNGSEISCNSLHGLPA
jgi:hypothetical protein